MPGDAAQPPFLAWGPFLEQLVWKQGEHVSLIGPTGTGKTTLALALLPRRGYAVALGTKPQDATLKGLQREGFARLDVLPSPDLASRVLCWPSFRKIEDVDKQRRVFRRLLRDVFACGSWCVFADEVSYLVNQLGLRQELEQLWLQGRSLSVSLVAATQRPAWVPLTLYTQATHLFLWRTNDVRDLKTVGGLNGVDDKKVRSIVAQLDRHEALYVNTTTGALLRTRVN